jgi:hypothetical protein
VGVSGVLEVYFSRSLDDGKLLSVEMNDTTDLAELMPSRRHRTLSALLRLSSGAIVRAYEESIVFYLVFVIEFTTEQRTNHVSCAVLM